MKQQEQIDNLKKQIEILEEKVGGLSITPKVTNKAFEDIKMYPNLKVDSLVLKYYNQDAEPDILANTIALWIDSDGGPAYYLIYNFNGTAKKVALT